MLSCRYRTAGATPPITECEHCLFAAVGGSTALVAKGGSTPRILASSKPDKSFLLHPGDAQAGKINVFVERSNFRHAQIFGTQMRDARVMIVAT